MTPRARFGPLLAALTALACAAPRPGNEAVPFEDLTLQNLVRWPDGREFIVSSGVGYPEENQTDVEERRRTAREGAATAAQQRLIVELKKLAPAPKVRELLRQVEVTKVDYAYDDICTVTLRLPKELLAVKESPW